MARVLRSTFLVVEACIEYRFDCARRHWICTDTLKVRVVAIHMLMMKAKESQRGELELRAVQVRARSWVLNNPNTPTPPSHINSDRTIHARKTTLTRVVATNTIHA